MRFCGYNINLSITKKSSLGKSKLFLVPFGLVFVAGLLKFIFIIFPLICLTALLCCVPLVFALCKRYLP